MSRQQFAFVIGVLLVWLAWEAGWVVLAAVAAGLIGWPWSGYWRALSTSTS